MPVSEGTGEGGIRTLGSTERLSISKFTYENGHYKTLLDTGVRYALRLCHYAKHPSSTRPPFLVLRILDLQSRNSQGQARLSFDKDS